MFMPVKDCAGPVSRSFYHILMQVFTFDRTSNINVNETPQSFCQLLILDTFNVPSFSKRHLDNISLVRYYLLFLYAITYKRIFTNLSLFVFYIYFAKNFNLYRGYCTSKDFSYIILLNIWRLL